MERGPRPVPLDGHALPGRVGAHIPLTPSLLITPGQLIPHGGVFTLPLQRNGAPFQPSGPK